MLVRDIMTKSPRAVTEDTRVAEGNKLVGMPSLGDVHKALLHCALTGC
jgi:hypothetical protein